MSPLYGLVVFAGVFFDMAIYTVWLKRRTAFSIIIGGLAGGMPVSGRARAGHWAASTASACCWRWLCCCGFPPTS